MELCVFPLPVAVRAGSTAPTARFASRVRAFASLALLRKLQMAREGAHAHRNHVLIEAGDGRMAEVVSNAALIESPGDASVMALFVDPTHSDGTAAEGIWQGCSVVDDQRIGVWSTVLYSCNVFDEARLDAASPGWPLVVAGALRRVLLARDDTVTLHVGGVHVSFAVTCNDSSAMGGDCALGYASPATAIALHRARALATDLSGYALEGPVWNVGQSCLLVDGGFSAAVVEALLRRHCPASLRPCVCTAAEALSNAPAYALVDALVLLDVDAVAAEPGDANKLTRLIASHRGTLVVVTSNSAALPASVAAALAHTARVTRKPATDSALVAWQPRPDALLDIVGRADALAMLRTVLDDVVGGRGPRVVWMYGAAGSGKSHMCNAFANAMADPARVKRATIAQLVHGYVGDSEKALAQLFRNARDMAPSVLLLDAADALFGNQRSALWAQLLQELDGLAAARAAVAVLMATTESKSLGPSLLQGGRLHHVVPLTAPTMATREEFVRYLGADMAVLSQCGDACSFGDIVRAARQTAFIDNHNK